MKRRFPAVALVILVPLALPACSKVQAKSAMKDGNKEYISDAEADAYRLKARGDMDTACGK